MRICLCLLVLGALIYGCNSNDDAIAPSTQLDSLIVQELDSIGVDYEFDETTGIYRYPSADRNIIPGRSIDDGRIFSIRYKLWVYAGDTIEQRDSLNGGPVKMRVGANAIYPTGIDRALASGIQEGEEWTFIFPDTLGYGSFSFEPLIPANSYLQFQVWVDRIQNDDEQLTEELAAMTTYVDSADLNDTTLFPLHRPEFLPSGMIYMRLENGDGLSPVLGNQVTLTYEGRLLDSTNFDSRIGTDAFTYTFSNGEVIRGLDEAVAEMSVGERALFIMPSGLAYQESAIVIPDVTEPGKNEYMRNHVLNQDSPIIPTYASKVGPYEVLLFEIDLRSVN